jgi:predicted lipoprotein with Yx(FWY)xxD motif
MRQVTKVCGAALVVLGFALLADQVLSAQAGGKMAMPPGVMMSKLADGTMALTDAKGMTLYTFGKDQPGVSNCNDNCAKNWPPLMAAADAKPMGEWTIVTRADGSRQWAYKGMPLYLWVKDKVPGDNTGNNVGVWKTAVP